MLDDDDEIIIDGAWVHSGWPFVLPQQATALHMLIATATDRNLDGSLDDLVDDVGEGWFDYFTGGLDCPIRWVHPDAAGDRRERRIGRAVRREFLTSFHDAGRTTPRTVRQLATTMAELGIFRTAAEPSRWRTVRWPPLVEEVLPVSRTFREADDRRRWLAMHEDTAAQIRSLFATRSTGDTITTSLAELAEATGCPEFSIGAGLEVLRLERVLSIRLPNGEDADIDTLAASEPVTIEVRADLSPAADLEW